MAADPKFGCSHSSSVEAVGGVGCGLPSAGGHHVGKLQATQGGEPAVGAEHVHPPLRVGSDGGPPLRIFCRQGITSIQEGIRF
jgi:hypothetical protein